MSSGETLQNHSEAASSSVLPKSPKVSHLAESPNVTTEETLPEVLPGMKLRDTVLPDRKLGKKDVRIVHNKNLSAEERNAIGERTRRVFAEKKAKRKQIAERLHKNKRLKMEEQDAKAEVKTEPPSVNTTEVEAIGKRIASLERTRRFKRGSLDVSKEKDVKKRKKRRVAAKSEVTDNVKATDETADAKEMEEAPIESGDEDVHAEDDVDIVDVEDHNKVDEPDAEPSTAEKQVLNHEDVNIGEPSTIQAEAVKYDLNHEEYVHQEEVEIMEDNEVYEEIVYVDEVDQYGHAQPIYYINEVDQQQIMHVVESYEDE